jgi:hypothetical protein
METRKADMKTIQIILGATLLLVPTLSAQVVNDGATHTSSNVTNTITDDATIGVSGSSAMLRQSFD